MTRDPIDQGSHRPSLRSPTRSTWAQATVIGAFLIGIVMWQFGLGAFIAWVVVPFASRQFDFVRDDRIPTLLPDPPSVILGFDRDFTVIFAMVLFVCIVGGAIILGFAVCEMYRWDSTRSEKH